MQNAIGWFEIYTNDLARATTFYETVFGIALEPMSDPEGLLQMMAFPSNMQGYGSCGALVNMPGVSAGGNSTVVYFMCDDCAVEASRVEGAGGRVEKPKFAIGEHGFCTLVKDTEGNLIGLHSRQ